VPLQVFSGETTPILKIEAPIITEGLPLISPSGLLCQNNFAASPLKKGIGGMDGERLFLEEKDSDNNVTFFIGG